MRRYAELQMADGVLLEVASAAVGPDEEPRPPLESGRRVDGHPDLLGTPEIPRQWRWPSRRVVLLAGSIVVVLAVAVLVSISVFGGHPSVVPDQALFGSTTAKQAVSGTTIPSTSTAGSASVHQSSAAPAPPKPASSPASSLPNLSVPAGFVLTSTTPEGPTGSVGTSRLVTYVGPGTASNTAGALASLLQGSGWRLTNRVAGGNFAGFIASADGWSGAIVVVPTGTSAGTSKVTIQLQACAKSCPG